MAACCAAPATAATATTASGSGVTATFMTAVAATAPTSDLNHRHSDHGTGLSYRRTSRNVFQRTRRPRMLGCGAAAVDILSQSAQPQLRRANRPVRPANKSQRFSHDVQASHAWVRWRSRSRNRRSPHSHNCGGRTGLSGRRTSRNVFQRTRRPRTLGRGGDCLAAGTLRTGLRCRRRSASGDYPRR